MSLEEWGWDDRWRDSLGPREATDGNVARVIGQDRDRWTVQASQEPLEARVTSSKHLDPYPVVGDWVIVDPGPTPSDPHSIRKVLPRRTALSRGVALTGASEQVLAANVDVVWLVHGLDLAVNARRLERYLAVAWESGAIPSIILTKADLSQDVSAAVAEARVLAMGAPVYVVSSNNAATVDELRRSVRPGTTVVLIGPSGVGKSTLINALAGSSLAETGEVRSADRKGRHVTVRRQLYVIPGGALLIDVPGIRELRVWELEEGLLLAFPDIDALARACRFRDCSHDTEPGCAVRVAVDEGRLDPARLDSLNKLRAEAAHQRRKMDPLARAAALSEHKTAMKTVKRDHPKYRRSE